MNIFVDSKDSTRELKYRLKQLKKQTILRGLSYSIPQELDIHINTIHHLLHLPPPVIHMGETKVITSEDARNYAETSINTKFHKHINLESIPVSQFDPELFHTYITPAALKTLYNINGTGNGYGSQTIYEANGQTFLLSDLVAFQKNLTTCQNEDLSYHGSVPSNLTCYGSPSNCEYSSMDLQYIKGVAGKIHIVRDDRKNMNY